MNTLTTETRREKIKEMLQKTDHPVTASSLAEHFSVSRQIIVGDIALLRASGLQILATPRGYLMDSPSVQEDKNLGMIACRHTPEQLRDELYTIVDGGATVVDVTIEHTLYGELSGKLDLFHIHAHHMYVLPHGCAHGENTSHPDYTQVFH